MTTTISYATANGGWVHSQNAAYATMRSGSSLTTLVNDVGTFGEAYDGSTLYEGYQLFLDFTYTPNAEEKITDAHLRLYMIGSYIEGNGRDFMACEYDWGGTLTTADWRSSAQLAALTTLVQSTDVEDAVSDNLTPGSDALVTRLASASPLRLIGMTQFQKAGTAPTGTQSELSWFEMPDEAGTDHDPALVYTTVTENDLNRVLGAAVQLSDGTHAYLERSSSTITLKYHNGTSASTIATVPTGTGSTDFNIASGYGGQHLALVRDDSDNLFVIGGAGNSTISTLAVKAYTKTVGVATWTAQTTRTASLPAYAGSSLNNVAAAYHSVGSGGTIVVAAAHGTGTLAYGQTGDFVYVLVNPAYALGTGGSALSRGSGSARGKFVSSATYVTDFFTPMVNGSGTGLDVAALPSTTDRGAVLTFSQAAQYGDTNTMYAYRYILASDGASFSAAHGATAAPVYAKKDGNAKVRVLPISSTTFAVVTADPTGTNGITVKVLQNTGTGSTFTTLGTVTLGNQGITTMPSASTLAGVQTWDATYHEPTNTVWVYYFDTANGRRLLRTSINLTTYLATTSVVEVAATTGAVGSTNEALRVHRGRQIGQKVLIAIGNETSGGVHSTTYIVDTINVTPSAPTLTPKVNYDATAAATFAWTFNDPGDTQSAYELEIERVDTGASIVDTGKVTSTTSSRNVTGGTLTNGLNYRWRVRTWDSSDVVSDFSDWGTFSTAAGGTVTVTDPASDNPAGVETDDYTISWSVSGTTQAAYNITVTSSGGTLISTGWVTSTGTTYNVAGMATGVEYTISVKVRNASLVESATGTRKITPDYDNVPVPTFTAVADDAGGFILISVTNPAPTGDNPSATANQVLRRVADSGDDYVVIAEIAANGTYRDYAAASGVTYDYLIRATA